MNPVQFLRHLTGLLLTTIFLVGAALADSAVRNETTRAVATALVELGDLHRDGKISKASGDTAYDYYLGLVAQSDRVFGAIQPDRLFAEDKKSGPRDLEAALRAYHKAAEFGEPDGFLRLSDLYFEGTLVAPDEDMAFSFAQKAKALGSEEADVRLGVMQIQGIGTEQDVVGGIARLQALADGGNDEALFELGQLLLSSSPDPAQAFAIFQKAALSDNVKAALEVARMQIVGEGVTEGPDKGLAAAQRLAESGSVAAMLLLGEVYSGGVPGRLSPDPARAYAAYRAAGQAGSDSGQAQAGTMLIHGQGVARDVAEGLKMLIDASDRGNADAMAALGSLYDTGIDGVLLPSAARSYYYFNRAAALGNVQASQKAALMLMEGRGTRADRDAALHKLKTLASQGNLDANFVLGEHFFSLSESDDDTSMQMAFRYFEQAARAGSVSAQVQLAEMLIRAQGIARDVARGLALLESAANAGDDGALMTLGRLYEHGVSDALEARPAAAYEFYVQAAAMGDKRAKRSAAFMELDGRGVSTSPARTLPVLESMARAGDPEANLRLAEYYAEQAGSGDRAMQEKVFAYVERAAAAESTTARIRMAEMLVRGEGSHRDVAMGLSELLALAESGNGKASLALGDIYARGLAGYVDETAALTSYENAAKQGQSAGLIRLSDIYRYGLFAKTDPARAIAYLEEAASLGNGYAHYLIGQGMIDGDFKSPDSLRSGVEYLLQAEALGVSEATVDLAILGNRGVAGRYQATTSLGRLHEALEAGDTAAGLRLVEAYREGYGSGARLTPRNLAKARTVLAQVSGDISPAKHEAETLLIDLQAAGRNAYSGFFPRIKALAPDRRPGVMRSILKADPNAFFYLLQQQLAEKGMFKGNPTGVLNSRTIGAVNAFCASIHARDLCRHGPMSDEVSTLLVYLF